MDLYNLDSRLRGNDVDLNNLDSRLRGNDVDLYNLDSRLRGNDVDLNNLDPRLRGNDDTVLTANREVRSRREIFPICTSQQEPAQQKYGFTLTASE